MAKCKSKVQKGPRKGETCGRVTYGETDACWGHQPKEVKRAKGFGGPQPNSGVPRKPRTIDRLRERVEELTDEIIAPFLDGLKAECCVGHAKDPETGERVPIMMPDLKRRQESARELMDRSYGKPKQISEVSGPEGGPIETTAGVAIPSDASAAGLHDLADELRKRRKTA